MNPITYYMNYGLPATGSVTFNRAPNTQPVSSATLTVTIGADTYTWLYPGAPVTTNAYVFWGSTNNEMAKSLAAAINADRSRSDLTQNTAPIKPYYAMYYQNVVVIISTIPGLVGNSFAISAASSDIPCFTLSGATLAGGSDQFASVARTNLAVAAPGGSNGTARIVGTSTPFQSAFFYGVKSWAETGTTPKFETATANSATVYIGENFGGKVYFSDPVATSLLPTIVTAPPNKYLDLSNFWLLAPTANDSVFVKYL